MSKVTYEVVEHDGGWAYKAGETFSETFQTHAEAHAAAAKAAAEHAQGGPSAEIEYEDSRGRWHQEHADGGDRPQTSLKD